MSIPGIHMLQLPNLNDSESESRLLPLQPPKLPQIPVVRTGRRFSSDDSFDESRQGFRNQECETSNRRALVRFNSLLNVILIPSRMEYRQARCDLWWSGTDFFAFQQAACSELKLLALYENIGIKDARKKLYQPSSVTGVVEDDDEEGYYDTACDYNDIKATQSNRINEIQTSSLFPKTNSLNHLSDLDKKEENKLRRNNSSQFVLSDSMNEEDAIAKELNFCVPSTKVEYLSLKERKSRKNSTGNHFLVALVGLFTLPIFGYYIAHYYMYT
eukprot:gene14422-19353_t